MYKKMYRDPKWLTEYVKKYLKGYSLNLCCGMSELGSVRVDIDPKVNPNIIADMWDLPFKRATFDSIYCDPIWSDFKLPNKHRFIYSLFELLKGGGYLIWNCNWAYLVLGRNTKIVDIHYHHHFRHGNVYATVVYKRPYQQIDEWIKQ